MKFETVVDGSSISWRSLIESLGLPWIRALDNLIKLTRIVKSRFRKGLYEVIEYNTTLELKDKKGIWATLRKYEKVRYLQDNIIAFQDQAWGDGKILVNYRCKPGIPVDTYRSGFKYHVLISLHDVKNRGDIDEFHIDWGIRRGYLLPTGFLATEINHYTNKVKIEVIFPKARPPLLASVFEKNRRRTVDLGKNSIFQLPNGKWEISWSLEHPRLYEQYILKWEW
jgi:hypothetical protein